MHDGNDDYDDNNYEYDYDDNSYDDDDCDVKYI